MSILPNNLKSFEAKLLLKLNLFNWIKFQKSWSNNSPILTYSLRKSTSTMNSIKQRFEFKTLNT